MLHLATNVCACVWYVSKNLFPKNQVVQNGNNDHLLTLLAQFWHINYWASFIFCFRFVRSLALNINQNSMSIEVNFLFFSFEYQYWFVLKPSIRLWIDENWQNGTYYPVCWETKRPCTETNGIYRPICLVCSSFLFFISLFYVCAFVSLCMLLISN